MSTQSLLLSLPESLYHQLKERAEQSNRTVEAEMIEVLSTAVPGQDIPSDASVAIAALELLDDDALWQAAKSHLSGKSGTALAKLNRKKQREGLTLKDEDRLRSLLQQYDRAMLIRARAAELLHQRGFDVSQLGPQK